MSSIIAAFPAAVYFVFVQNVVGFGSVPHPQEPFVRSLYLVVDAHGFPLNIGGQPWHFESTGVAKLSQEELLGVVGLIIETQVKLAFNRCETILENQLNTSVVATGGCVSIS